MPPTIPKQQDLVERELEIGDAARLTGREPFHAICEDRAERYREHLFAMSVPEELQAWAGQMKVEHGTDQCVVWKNPLPLPWVVGLLVLIYGEHEHFWPQKLGESDIRRAEAWVSGRKSPRRGEVKPYHGQEA